MENDHVVIVFHCLDVFHAAVTHFDFISVEYLVKGILGNGYLLVVKSLKALFYSFKLSSAFVFKYCQLVVKV